MPSAKASEPNGDVPGSKPAAGLYVVATPLGNLGDITRRAIAILAGADIVACEDTRVTRRLFAALKIPARRLVRYDDHSADRVRPALIQAVHDGQTVALVSDAGTPLIADPGYKLVRDAHAAGLAVIPVPGPSATMAALCAAGLPTDRFLFCGFLPAKAGERARVLAEIKAVPATLVFFESARRLPRSLAQLAEALGGREAAVARELTKLFEEIRRGSLADLARHYADAGAPKGEVVIVVGPPASHEAGTGADAAAELDAALNVALKAMSLRDAAAAVATATGLPRRQVYARALALAGSIRP
jgi:16S rRNA (cytidine1402-2'-O)-methyltransferase